MDQECKLNCFIQRGKYLEKLWNEDSSHHSFLTKLWKLRAFHSGSNFWLLFIFGSNPIKSAEIQSMSWSWVGGWGAELIKFAAEQEHPIAATWISKIKIFLDWKCSFVLVLTTWAMRSSLYLYHVLGLNVKSSFNHFDDETLNFCSECWNWLGHKTTLNISK